MTYEDIESELDRDPFIPFRLHLVSGKTLDVRISDDAWMLQHAVVVLQRRKSPSDDTGYDTISLRNIERVEQLYGLERDSAV